MNFFTLNNHLENFRNFGVNHQQIHSVFAGDVSRIDLDKNVKYPLMWIQFIEMSPNIGELEYKFRFIFADCPKDDDIRNEEEIKSDMSTVALDLLNFFKTGVFRNVYTYKSNSVISPFTEKYPNILTGVFIDITFSVPNDYQSCDLPLDNFIVVTGATNDQVIVITKEDIFTTDAKLSGSTIVFDRNDLNDAYSVDLSPILTGGTANFFTTGATLSGNVISYDRNDLNDAYSVDLSPILSGITTDNFFTTGVTTSGNTLIFDRNDLSDAYSVDLSSLLTGSTSPITGLTDSLLYIDSNGDVATKSNLRFDSNLTDDNSLFVLGRLNAIDVHGTGNFSNSLRIFNPTNGLPNASLQVRTNNGYFNLYSNSNSYIGNDGPRGGCLLNYQNATAGGAGIMHFNLQNDNIETAFSFSFVNSRSRTDLVNATQFAIYKQGSFLRMKSNGTSSATNAVELNDGANNELFYIPDDRSGLVALSDGSVGIGNNPDASAKLDVFSTTQGFLPPRMTTAEREGILNPAIGLIVYDTDEDVPVFFANNGGTPRWETFNKTPV